MKTLFYFTLIMALVIPGCQMEDPAVPGTINNRLQVEDMEKLPLENSLDFAACEKIRTDHQLAGKAEWVVPDFSTGFTEPQYVITAYGEAQLNEKEIGRTVLTLVYEPVRGTYSVSLETTFSGQDMVHRFTGLVGADFSTDADQDQKFAFEDQPESVRGYVNRENGNLLLRDGALAKISVAPNDEGHSEILITIIGDYCGWRKIGTRN